MFIHFLSVFLLIRIDTRRQSLCLPDNFPRLLTVRPAVFCLSDYFLKYILRSIRKLWPNLRMQIKDSLRYYTNPDKFVCNLLDEAT